MHKFHIFLFTTLLAVNISLAHGANELPDMGSTASRLLTPAQENLLGREFMRSVREHYKVIDDPISIEYIQSIGLKLASYSGTTDQPFQFFIIADSDINAFAGPGGYIGVNSGLITASHSEGELASVLAHEIAHVSQKHLVRSVEASSNVTLAAMAAMFAALLLSKGNGEVNQAVIVSALAGTQEQQMSFSRAHEQEADRVGIEMLVSAGYSPNYMADFFDTLQQKNRLSGVSTPIFLLTHPVTASRIADARGRAAQFATTPQVPHDEINFQLFNERIKYLTRPVTSQNQASSHQATKPNATYPARYGLALNLLGDSDYAAARTVIQGLIKDDKTRLPYLITQAEIEIQSGQDKRAVEILDSALSIFPRHPALSTLYATALLRTGQTKQALQVIKSQLTYMNQSEQPEFQKLYATAAKQANLMGLAYEAMANYYYLKGNTRIAIKHLEKALLQSDSDSNNQLKIKARLEELKQELINNQALETSSNPQLQNSSVH